MNGPEKARRKELLRRYRTGQHEDARRRLGLSQDDLRSLLGFLRRGVGEHVARSLFDRFWGRWEIDKLRENVAAQAFWGRVIGRYTGGRYREVELDDDRWRGPVQAFTSAAGQA